jgi:multidrug transporter EmrE-like cation transporter
MGYLYILLTILFTVYGQLIIKWQVSKAGGLPADGLAKIKFLGLLLLNPWVISGFGAALIAALAWMAALTKFDLSYAYPFMSLSFVLVMLASAWLLHEPLTLLKIVGLGLVIIGLIISSRST